MSVTVETPGVCAKTPECEYARRGSVVRVPLGAPFVCPGCGSRLAPPLQHTAVPARRTFPSIAVLGLAAVVLTGGAVLAGRFLATGHVAVPALALRSSTTAPSPMPVRTALSAPPVLPAPPPPATSTRATLASSPAHEAVPPLTVTQADPASLPPPAPKADVVAPLAVQPASGVTGTAGGSGSQSGTSSAKLAALPPTLAPTEPAPSPATVTGQPAPPAAPRSAVAPGPPPAASAPSPAIPAALQTATQLEAPMPTPSVAAPVNSGVAPPSLTAMSPATLPPAPGAGAQAVPDPPFNPVPLAGGVPAYPASLAADGRPGRVLVTCQITPDGRPQGCRAGAAKGGAAFTASVLAWLDRGQVRYRPVTLHGRAVPATRSWTIALDEPPAALAKARHEAAALAAANAVYDGGIPLPAAPAGNPQPPPAMAEAARPVPMVTPVMAKQIIKPPAPPPPPLDRPFSTRVLSGGQPQYPAIYGETRSGTVTVSCRIGTDGSPSACRILDQEGGLSFGHAVEAWLRSGRVRFAPIVQNGQTVAQTETWTVTFRPPQ